MAIQLFSAMLDQTDFEAPDSLTVASQYFTIDGDGAILVVYSQPLIFGVIGCLTTLTTTVLLDDTPIAMKIFNPNYGVGGYSMPVNLDITTTANVTSGEHTITIVHTPDFYDGCDINDPNQSTFTVYQGSFSLQVIPQATSG